LTENGQLVDALRIALSQTEGIDSTPAILRRVLDEDAWRDRLEHRIDGRYTFDTFEEFAEAKPLDGLGMHVADIEAILKVRDEHDLLRQLREACKHQGKRNLRNNVTEARRGNSRSGTLDRLHREHRKLYDQVIAGELTANAAAIEAGFRKPTASVPVDTAEHAVAALNRRFSLDEIQAAVATLRGQSGGSDA
jgi:hypothetical protein